MMMRIDPHHLAPMTEPRIRIEADAAPQIVPNRRLAQPGWRAKLRCAPTSFVGLPPQHKADHSRMADAKWPSPRSARQTPGGIADALDLSHFPDVGGACDSCISQP